MENSYDKKPWNILQKSMPQYEKTHESATPSLLRSRRKNTSNFGGIQSSEIEAL